jgi:hypothetical protein
MSNKALVIVNGTTLWVPTDDPRFKWLRDPKGEILLNPDWDPYAAIRVGDFQLSNKDLYLNGTVIPDGWGAILPELRRTFRPYKPFLIALARHWQKTHQLLSTDVSVTPQGELC